MPRWRHPGCPRTLRQTMSPRFEAVQIGIAPQRMLSGDVGTWGWTAFLSRAWDRGARCQQNLKTSWHKEPMGMDQTIIAHINESNNCQNNVELAAVPPK
jgi:hypothetical protein